MTSAPWGRQHPDRWHPDDPDRPCYTCGEAPSGHFSDGSPFYACGRRGAVPHVAVEATPEELAAWSGKGTGDVLVTLTEEDLAEVAAHVERVLEAVARHGFRDRFTPAETDRQLKLRTYAAEVAVARYLDLPWHPVVLTGRTRKSAKPSDVGGNVEVRTYPAPTHCPVRTGDRPDSIIVLVVGRPPTFRLVGWCVAGEVMVPEHWHEDKRDSPYWRVPASALRRFPIPPGLAR